MSEPFSPIFFNPQNCSLPFLEQSLTLSEEGQAKKIFDHFKENIEKPLSQHTLILGPPGTGKSHLVCFLQKKIKENYPSIQIFQIDGEKSGITNLKDFVHTLLSKERLLSHGDFNDIPKNEAISEWAIKVFRNTFPQKKIVIIIENISELLQSFEKSNITSLITFFQDYPEGLSVLATSRPSFQLDQNFQNLFKIFSLSTLNRKGSFEYLLSLAKLKKDKELFTALKEKKFKPHLQTIYDLTSGNQRLLTILSDYLSLDAFHNLALPFISMIDRVLFLFYQRQFDRLSPQQNKLLKAIAHHGGKALTVNEIALFTNLPSTTVSRQLYDLLQQGLVSRNQVGRESFYEINEPLARFIINMKEGHGLEDFTSTIQFLKYWHFFQEFSQEEEKFDFTLTYQHIFPEEELFQEGLLIKEEVLPALLQRLEAKELLQKGLEFLKKKNFLLAYEEFKKIAAQHSSDVTVWIALAVTLQVSEKTEKSLAAYDQLLNRFGGSNAPDVQEMIAETLVNKGNLLHKLKRPEEAIGIYDQILNHFSENQSLQIQRQILETLFNKGKLLEQKKHYEEAVKVFNLILQKVNHNQQVEEQNITFQALLQKGRIFRKLHNYDMALDALDALEELTKGYQKNSDFGSQKLNAQALILRADIYREFGRPEKAIIFYQKIIDLFRGKITEPQICYLTTKALFCQGQIFSLLNQKEKALNSFEQAVEYLSECTDSNGQNLLCKALREKVKILISMGEYQKSLDIFDTLLRMDLNDQEALKGKIFSLLQLKKEKEALDYLEKLLSIIPSPHETRIIIAQYLITHYFQDEEKLNQIISSFKTDHNSLAAGLIGLLVKVILQQQKPGDIKALKTSFEQLPDAKFTLDIIEKIVNYLNGETRALLRIPKEIRQLIPKSE